MLRRLRDLSIRQKLMRIGMLASATALATAMLAFGLYDVLSFRNDFVQRLSTQAEIVGQNTVSALLFNDADAAREILSSLEADEHVRAAVLYDEGGAPFTTWWRDGPAPASTPLEERIDDGHDFGADHLRVRRRIFFRGSHVGAVVVEADLRELRDRMARYAGILLLVFLGSFLAARLTSSRFESAISAPILNLADTARAVSRDRDYSVRAESGGRDELGLLIGTFNDMLEQIQRREAELQEARSLLEHRVQERTAELQHELRERQRAQQALEHSEVQLREAQRLSQIGSWSWDLDTRGVSWSDEMKRLLSLPADAPAGIEVLVERAHPADREALALALRGAADEGLGFGLDHRVPVADGGFRVLHSHATVALDQGGRAVRVLGTGQDVTERKAAEAEQAVLLREQLARAAAEAAQARATMLSDVSAALGASLDTHGALPAVARAAVPLVGDACAILVGGSDAPPPVAAAAPELEAAIRAALGDLQGSVAASDDAPVRPSVAELELARRAGLRDVYAMPVTSGGSRLGTLLIGRVARELDVDDKDLATGLADRIGSALENARLYAELRNANRLKDEFLATLSHELRTPLNAIVGWTKLLQTGELPGSSQERAVATIDRNARALARLIDDILDVSRIVSGKLQLDIQPVDLDAVVTAALDSVRPAAVARSIRVDYEPPPSLLPVQGDAHRLQQVVWNLLSNAIKFTPVGGVVAVTVSGEPGFARVVVTDTGIGISPAFLPHVFDRFRQADSSSTRAHGGLGLGLAIVRHLAELHGGTVEARSEGPGHGASFELTLPVKGASRGAFARHGETPADPRPEAPGTAHTLDGVDVLVVDDEPDTRDLVRVMLERVGAAVRTASSADEAMRLFEEAPSAVLLTDIEMPGGDGYALLERIRALGADNGGNVPAAALTAYARPEDRSRALRAGFQVHVAKPVQPDELTAAVASLALRPKTPSLDLK